MSTKKKRDRDKNQAAVALGRRRVETCDDWSGHCRLAHDALYASLTDKERSAIARLGGLAAQENRRRRRAAAEKS